MNRRATFIAIGAAVALLALWFVLLWGPQGGRLEDARERTSVADAQNEELELRVARLEAAQDSAPARMAELANLRRAVPGDPELAQFILDANQVASETGVDFLSISPSVPAAGVGGLPPVIGLSITVTGEYFAVLDYLDRVGDLPRIVVIDTLGLSPGDGGDELSVSISGRMFATSAPQLAPVIPTPGSPTTTSTSAVPVPVSAVRPTDG